MNRKQILISFMILLIPLLIFAKKAPFTIETLYQLKSVSDPQISPNGKKIAYVVKSYNLKEGKSNSDIWLMDARGGEPVQLTQSEKADHHPRWSPDGKTLMFLSSREEGSQIWRLPANGGEAVQLTHLSYGISDPMWLPDGKSILFNTEVFPEYGAVDSLNQRDTDAMNDGPVQAHMANKLLYRHWTSYSDGRYTHTLLLDVDSGKVKDLTPGEYNAPRFSLGGWGYEVSPDGKEVCVVSNHDDDPWSSTNADLFTIEIDSGKMTNITDKNEAYDGNPLYSPDGNYIAYVSQKIPRFEADRFRLTLYNRESGESIVLTESFDYWVDDYVWSPDSKSLYFIADVEGHSPLYKVDVKSLEISKIADVKTINSIDLSPDGKWFALIRRAINEPTELYRMAWNGKGLTRLTFVNQKIEDEVDIRPAEELWIEGAEGIKVHTFLIKPHNFDPAKKHPLIINVHGGPQMMWSDAFRGDWQVYPGSGYVLAFPNPHGSSGYGQSYTDAISKDWGGKVYEDVMKVTDALAELPFVDADRIGAMG